MKEAGGSLPPGEATAKGDVESFTEVERSRCMSALNSMEDVIGKLPSLARINGHVTAAETETTQRTDHALAQAAAEGDMSAFEELYARHNRRVYSLCLRMTQNVSEAEDLAQEV
ncbi:MAG TPA: sigma factor, partial [Pyrinomonadaceae bacterium]